jgi:epoxyqueuosine reductase
MYPVFRQAIAEAGALPHIMGERLEEGDMNPWVLDTCARHGDQATFIAIERLVEARQELEALERREVLNDFQRVILHQIFELDLPALDFLPRSILLVATPSPGAAELQFHWQGRARWVKLPRSYVDKRRSPVRILETLEGGLAAQGYHLAHAPRLPHKLLAVRSGLGKYGRNNLVYVAGMGSFINLNLFFSDLPCPDDGWCATQMMAACEFCRICQQACPTAAIRADRVLLDNERCLPYFNEAGSEWDFPDWIDPAAHHCLYGCLRCQNVCPVNHDYLHNGAPVHVAFSPDETGALLEGRALDDLPTGLRAKVEALDMQEYLGAIPRNLRALLAQPVG